MLKLHISTFILVRKIIYIQYTTLQFKMQHFRSQRFYSTFTNVFAFIVPFPFSVSFPRTTDEHFNVSVQCKALVTPSDSVVLAHNDLYLYNSHQASASYLFSSIDASINTDTDDWCGQGLNIAIQSLRLPSAVLTSLSMTWASFWVLLVFLCTTCYLWSYSGSGR